MTSSKSNTPQGILKPWHYFLLYVLIFLSGTSGLIYEVVWQKYLVALLGAQARATAVVLAIFLGGISLGYWAFGNWSRKAGIHLFRTYAAIEFAIGAWAISFPYLFRFLHNQTPHLFQQFGLESILLDFSMAILLLGVPTFLMGGTLPLLTQAMSQDVKQASPVHAKIYGFNTIGAGLGCLAAGYFLIPMTTLPTALVVGGVQNFAIGLIVLVFFGGKKYVSTASEPMSTVGVAKSKVTRPQLAILGVGILSGYYLISLQTIVIRLAGLTTGSSNYTFSLVVSIFIFALGAGSLMARRIQNYDSNRLLRNQIIVCVSLVLLYISGDYWAYAIHLIRTALRSTPQNFYFYQVLLAIFFSVVLFVPVAFSGLTLPLCFHMIKDRKETLGHRVGQLYGLNTVGCVLGALLGGYFLFNFLNLDQLLKLCILCGLVSVAILLPFSPSSHSRLSHRTVGGMVIASLLVALWFLPQYDKNSFIQAFRYSDVIEPTFQGKAAFAEFLGNGKHSFYKDGPNSTVAVLDYMNGPQLDSRSVIMNGKSDGDTSGDIMTMQLVAHLAGLFSRSTERACVIGFGTGVTAGTLTLYPSVKKVELVEISETLLDAAHLFDKFNFGVTKNPKISFHMMDAFRYLEGASGKFDLVISEPSNPWVSGVENLFSDEYYDMVKRKLTPTGMIVQWINAYAFNEALFKMVLKTMSGHFKSIAIFRMQENDIALIGTQYRLNQEDIFRAEKLRNDNGDVRKALASLGVKDFVTLLSLQSIAPDLVPAIAKGAPIHRLESPRLSNEAAKAFFSETMVDLDKIRRKVPDYYYTVHGSLLVKYLKKQPLTEGQIESLLAAYCGFLPSRNVDLCRETLALRVQRSPSTTLSSGETEVLGVQNAEELANLKTHSVKGEEDYLEEAKSAFLLYRKLFSPIAYFPPDMILAPLEQCLKDIPSTSSEYGECLARRLEVAQLTGAKYDEIPTYRSEFLAWFAGIDRNTRDHARFQNLKNLIEKTG